MTEEPTLLAQFLDILKTSLPEGTDRLRWLRGQHYSAARRIARLTAAWPEPNREQQVSLNNAEVWYEACTHALNEELAKRR